MSFGALTTDACSHGGGSFGLLHVISQVQERLLFSQGNKTVLIKNKQSIYLINWLLRNKIFKTLKGKQLKTNKQTKSLVFIHSGLFCSFSPLTGNSKNVFNRNLCSVLYMEKTQMYRRGYTEKIRDRANNLQTIFLVIKSCK